MKLLSPSALLALLFLLGACSSPSSGQLNIGGADDAVGDDDGAGDDDDGADDDDGDDDDDTGPTSPLEGDWWGGTYIYRAEEGSEVCQGDAFFGVGSDGAFEGDGDCPLEGGPNGGAVLEFEWDGVFAENSEFIEGTAVFYRGEQTFEFDLDGGVDLWEGTEFVWVSWGMTLGGGPGGGFPVTVEAWGVRDWEDGGEEGEDGDDDDDGEDGYDG